MYLHRLCVGQEEPSSRCACRQKFACCMHVFQGNCACRNNAATCELCIFREKQSERGTCNIMQPWFRIWSCLSNENCVVFIEHCSRTRVVEHCINWSSFPARAARYNISCAIHTGGPHLKKPSKSWGTPLVCFWEHKYLNGGDLEGCIFIIYICVCMYVCR